MPISPVNLRWLIAPHDLHGMLTPRLGEEAPLLGHISFTECYNT
jgi:hypothetical protein